MEAKQTYTNADILRTLPDGSVVSFNDEIFRWMKMHGQWHHSMTGYQLRDDWDSLEGFELHIKYWGDL